MRPLAASVALVCALAAVTVQCSETDGDHEHESAFQMADADNSTTVSPAEWVSVVGQLIDDEELRSEHCPNVTHVFDEHDADKDGMLSSDEFVGALYEFAACAIEGTNLGHATITVGDAQYICAFGHDHEEEDGHDHEGEEEVDGDHDHRRRLVAAGKVSLRRRRLGDGHNHGGGGEADSVVLTFAGGDVAGITCTKVAEAPKQSDLSDAEVWVLSLCATAIVTMATLTGLVMGQNALKLVVTRYSAELAAVSAGALIGGVFIHLLPETAASGLSKELGGWIVGGFAAAFIIEGATHSVRAHVERQLAARDAARTEGVAVADVELAEVGGEGAKAEATESKEDPRQSPAESQNDERDPSDSAPVHRPSFFELPSYAHLIIVGDLFHNITDGMLIAAAFRACSAGVGWTVMFAIVLHEVPQEVADFALLVHSGMSVCRAIFWNVLSGCSAFVGAIATLLVSSVSDTGNTTDELVAIGSGFLLYIGAVEVLPMVFPHQHGADHSSHKAGNPSAGSAGVTKNHGETMSLGDFLRRTALFGMGLGAISLATLFDEHCDA